MAFAVPAAKKLELISLFAQTNGSALYNFTVGNIDPVTGFSFVFHQPASTGGQAAELHDLRNFVCRPGSSVIFNVFAGPANLNMAMTAILVDI